MRPYHHFIESPAWWDVVAPGQWDAAIVQHNDEIVARLPYVVTRRGGVTRIGAPPLTPWTGPFFSDRGVKTATRLHNEVEWARALTAQLPTADAIQCQAPPEVHNLAGFVGEGFALTASFTYRITLEQPLDAIWDAMMPRTRQNIRKAEKLVDIVEDAAGDRVAAMVVQSFGRQQIDVGHWRTVIGRIVTALGPTGHARGYVAQGRDGPDHGGVLCVGDERSTLYICGGADPALRSSNAQSLLLWHAIREAHGRSTLFDFCGSMKPSIARHFESFGAQQAVKLGVVRDNARYRLATAAYGMTRSATAALRRVTGR